MLGVASNRDETDTHDRQEALDAAHTQHRQKTNAQLATLADAVIEHFSTSPTDTTLGKLREDSSRNPDEVRLLLESQC